MKESNVYIGETIKQVMVKGQVAKAEPARRLGVKLQSTDYLLTRKSIDTDTLHSSSLVPDYDFAVLYSIKKGIVPPVDEEGTSKMGDARVTLGTELRQDEMLKLNLEQKITDPLKGKGKRFCVSNIFLYLLSL